MTKKHNGRTEQTLFGMYLKINFHTNESQHNRHQNRQQKIDATRHKYSSIKHEFDSKHLNKIEEGVKRYG